MESKNAVIIYSWSSLWSMKNKSGAPSFYKTIKLYVDKGWDVFLVLTDASNGGSNIVDDEHVFVLPKQKSDGWISPKNSTKIFLLWKMARYYMYSKTVTKKIMANVSPNILFYAYEVHGVSAAKWASKKYHKPLITRFQGTVATYFKDNLLTRIKQYFCIKALKTQADLVIMTDDGTKGLETLRKLGNPSEKICFWRNGLDLLSQNYCFDEQSKEGLRKDIGIMKDETMLLTVSRLQDWKRVDRAINALAKVVETDTKFKLVIAGDGPEKENLVALAKEKNVEKNVIFLGAVPHDKVYDYMSCTDIFLSLYDMSNVGNPLLEALTLGKCIITLDVGDTNKVIHNKKNGFILGVKELDQLPDLILKIAKDKELKIQIENQAKCYANQEFYTWEKRMEMEYQEVCKLLK